MMNGKQPKTESGSSLFTGILDGNIQKTCFSQLRQATIYRNMEKGGMLYFLSILSLPHDIWMSPLECIHHNGPLLVVGRYVYI